MKTSRLTSNLHILSVLEEYLIDNPDIRFGQALRNLNIVRELRGKTPPHDWVNEFYTESSEILDRALLTEANSKEKK